MAVMVVDAIAMEEVVGEDASSLLVILTPPFVTAGRDLRKDALENLFESVLTEGAADPFVFFLRRAG
jgi:hypothetical protein